MPAPENAAQGLAEEVAFRGGDCLVLVRTADVAAAKTHGLPGAIAAVIVYVSSADGRSATDGTRTLAVSQAAGLDAAGAAVASSAVKTGETRSHQAARSSTTTPQTTSGRPTVSRTPQP